MRSAISHGGTAVRSSPPAVLTSSHQCSRRARHAILGGLGGKQPHELCHSKLVGALAQGDGRIAKRGLVEAAMVVRKNNYQRHLPASSLLVYGPNLCRVFVNQAWRVWRKTSDAVVGETRPCARLVGARRQLPITGFSRTRFRGKLVPRRDTATSSSLHHLPPHHHNLCRCPPKVPESLPTAHQSGTMAVSVLGKRTRSAASAAGKPSCLSVNTRSRSRRD